jgi:hypothetical protein
LEEQVEVSKGEQLALIVTTPENSKEIIRHAKKYKAAMQERVAALAIEKEEKQVLLGLIKESGAKPVDGKITLNLDGFKITVTPRDELVKVKEDGESESED